MHINRIQTQSHAAALRHADERDLRRFLRNDIDRYELVACVLQSYHDHVESVGMVFEDLSEEQLRAACRRLLSS